jgi:Zn-dependent protease
LTSTFSLGRIAGIPLGLHYSFFVLLALLTWRVSSGFLPNGYPDWSPWIYWATGTVAAVLLSLSVVVHELAHSLVARRRGIPVHGIVMFILGGVSELEADSKRARDEFLIAVVGPATSFLLSAILFGITVVLGGGDSPLEAIVLYLAIINLLLGIFNLLPVFPLDGGRVLRSVIWALTGSHTGATKVAAILGRTAGLGLIVLGVWQFVSGNPLGGVWLGFIGWFVQVAARRSKSDAESDHKGSREGPAPLAGVRGQSPRPKE